MDDVIACNSSKLKLFLATRDDGWLQSEDPDIIALKKGEISDDLKKTYLELAMVPEASVGELIAEANLPDPSNRQIHVLVVIPEPSEAAGGKATVLKKRKLAEMNSLITPSSFAKCRGSGTWVKWLKNLDGQIECHRIERSNDRTLIPLVLLNENFARFEENCKRIESTKLDCEFVVKLCHGMSTPYESKAALAEKARELLRDYLLADYSYSTITPATANGSVSDSSYRYGKTLLLNRECRLQKGDGGGDPTMQNIACYIKSLPNVVDRQFPCFLVDICGPLTSIFGL